LFTTLQAEDAQATFIKVLQDESLKPGIASTNAFVLVEWCSILLQDLVDSPERFERWVEEIMRADARALETCFASTTRGGLKHSAIIVTRRALRKVFTAGDLGQKTLKQTISLLTTSRSACRENAVFLGVVGGVCARLSTAQTTLEDSKKDIYAFYAKEIIGSRTVVPPHIAGGLHDFFLSLSTSEDVQKEVAPPLEKALLRAPEVVLNGLIPPWARALPEEIDLSEILHTRLLKPLLTNLKSTNAEIRGGAIISFESIASRCHDETWLSKTTEEILTPLKTSKLPNAEHRALHAQMFTAIPPSTRVSTAIVCGLAPVSVKEVSENALVAETVALGKHLSYAIGQGADIDKTVFEAMIKGCGDKRNPFRKAWITAVGEAIWELDDSSLSNPQGSKEWAQILTKISEVFEEIATNPLPFAQNGLVAMAYVFTALSHSKYNAFFQDVGSSTFNNDKVSKKALAMSPKPSFLLNHRIYSKLISEKDISWMLRALTSVSAELGSDTVDSASNDAWSQALFFLMTGADVLPKARREAVRTMRQLYAFSPAKIGKVIVAGIWRWIEAIEQGEKDSAATAAKCGLDRLNIAVTAMTTENGKANANFPKDALQDQVVSLLVLCQPKLLPRTNWIRMALKSGIDPGSLAKEKSMDCLNQVLINTEVSNFSHLRVQKLQMTISQGSPQAQFIKVNLAAYRAAAELAFVAPNPMILEIVKQVQSDLDVTQMAHLGPTEAAIARTPEGIAFVDVLGTAGKNHLSDKNIKDYDTLKWEEELKSQIAKKKGQQRKLTADETAKVNAQLAKEAAIRKEVLIAEHHIKRGAGIAKGLAEGPPTDAAAWLNQILRALLDVARKDAGLFVGDLVSTAVISCSAPVTARLGTLRPFIGVATLRALGESYLSAEYMQEPLGGMLSA
jgi:hypothetical protein